VCRKHDPLSLLTTVAVFGPVPSHGQGKDFVVNQGLRPFEFSGELNLGCRHFREYVPTARISRSARRFGAVQRAYPAIERVGHPGLALREVLGMRILPAGDKPC
jgi:hypothetical protein